MFYFAPSVAAKLRAIAEEAVSPSCPRASGDLT